MALPVRLTTTLGRHPDDLTEDDLQRAVDNQIPEGVDLDWKKDFYQGTDAGKKELAKDVSAMANTVGGLLVIGVDDGKKDHAHALAPFEPIPNRGEEWIRSVLANWIQPVVPNVGVRSLKSADEGKIYWILSVPPSTQMPHAVAAPGNDYNFRVHVRHGSTTRTLPESEVAQRYRDRFHAATTDTDHLHDIATAGVRHLTTFVTGEVPAGGSRASWYPLWISVTAVPTVRGNYPLTTREERDAALQRFTMLAYQAVTTNMKPEHPALVGRRQVRFEGFPTGQLHQDGSSFTARPLNVRKDEYDEDAPRKLYQRGFELELVTQVQVAAAWAAETGGAGDVMLSAALHCFDDGLTSLRVVTSEDDFQRGPAQPIPKMSAQTTANLQALVADKHEAVSAAYALVADLLADVSVHQPYVLTPEGDIRLERLNSEYRSELTGW
ncbi:helix-turn-helix domain-containing protein [Streptomyces sp. NRRL S-1824]|uniref:AlbA family DNA-binding domain-containing protein n=1 Tax=Streptomyces sp. NRRL S-1824 TaxID=1463889 RepID=UPI000689A34C|nr:ATP-binding protein [Streptomyces sp. NRRL S-1824]